MGGTVFGAGDVGNREYGTGGTAVAGHGGRPDGRTAWRPKGKPGSRAWGGMGVDSESVG